MDVLVIGGNRFMGRSLVLRLLFARHRVTVLNRGTLPAPEGAAWLRADRTTGELDRVLDGRTFDAVIDFACFTGDDARGAVRALASRTGHYVMISTGQVYLVREGLQGVTRESDYAGPVMAAPPTPDDRPDWEYGIGKRDAEDVIAAATELRSTRLRIPMVSGEGDPKLRYERYLWRMLDGGPLFVPNPEAIARHVYRGHVVEAIVKLLERRPDGDVFNVAQVEQPTVRELVELIGRAAGCAVTIETTPASELLAAGIDPRDGSPFSSRWMSRIDPSRAIATLALEQVPLDEYVRSIVAHALANLTTPPPGYHEQRAKERGFRRR
ncbi:MAG: NAD-dependent epimerase/dehydratase family protein [Myxococcales bacterium]|nr:NAD-dependent epimerase/dehydratase family protein [Myxococcales bacterium]